MPSSISIAIVDLKGGENTAIEYYWKSVKYDVKKGVVQAPEENSGHETEFKDPMVELTKTEGCEGFLFMVQIAVVGDIAICATEYKKAADGNYYKEPYADTVSAQGSITIPLCGGPASGLAFSASDLKIVTVPD